MHKKYFSTNELAAQIAKTFCKGKFWVEEVRTSGIIQKVEMEKGKLRTATIVY